MRRFLYLIVLILAFPVRAQVPTSPACRAVGDAPFIIIDPAAAGRLAVIGLDRAAIFVSMRDTSIPETMGCWAMPVGNFDSQLISVGMAQWNYGTGSLQPVLTAWRDGFGSRRRFKRDLRALAPTYGKLLLSKDCLKAPVRRKCRDGILAAHGADGKINATLAGELTAIFESDAMLQVQAGTYVRLLEEVRGELLRMWPVGPYSMRKVRWAIDTRVQQKSFPGDEDIARLRGKIAVLPESDRADRLLSAQPHRDGQFRAVAGADLFAAGEDHPGRRQRQRGARRGVRLDSFSIWFAHALPFVSSEVEKPWHRERLLDFARSERRLMQPERNQL